MGGFSPIFGHYGVRSRVPPLSDIVRIGGENNMNKLCIFVGMTVFGWVGWWIGAKVGMMTAFILSGIGSIVGIYVGWRIYRDYLS